MVSADNSQPPDEALPRFVVWHPELGIYLGGVEGGTVSWWSNDGTAANLSAVTFLDDAEVTAWFCDSTEEAWFGALNLTAVEADLPHDAASPDASRAAGLEQHLGTLANPAWLGMGGRC